MIRNSFDSVTPQTSLVHYKDTTRRVVIATEFFEELNTVIYHFLSSHARRSLERSLRGEAAFLHDFRNNKVTEDDIEVG